MNKRPSGLLSIAASAACLIFACIFALVAYVSKVKSLPTPPTAILKTGGSSVLNQNTLGLTARYDASLSVYASYQRDLLFAVGLGLVAAFLLIGEASLHSRFVLRRALTGLVLTVSSILAVLYLSLVMLNIHQINIRGPLPPWLPLIRSLWDFIQASPEINIGVAACVFFACASVGFAVGIRSIRQGWLKAARDSVRLFVIPALFFLISEVWVFERFEMSDHVADFAVWSYDGVYILSNWSLLLLASLLAVLFYLLPIFRAVTRVERTSLPIET